MEQQARILVVDDDPHVLESIARSLEEVDYATTSANCGKQALELLNTESFDIVLSDIVMQDINGLQLLEEIKKLDLETDVILMTGFGTLETAVEALRMGAADFMVKPCEIEELELRIENALKKNRLEKKARQAEIYQKMSQALGAVAHEVNNPLTVIMVNADLLVQKYPNDPALNDKLGKIITQSNKITEIIQKMRDLQGIKTKQYTSDSQILDLQKHRGFTKPTTKTVLLVDDEPNLLNATAAGLSLQNYAVDMAESGAKALDLIQACNYSVVIMDISMPELDGYETLQRMNAWYTEHKIRIPATIMWTGYDVEGLLDKCKEIGAFTALRKPIRIDSLLQVVKEAEAFAEA